MLPDVLGDGVLIVELLPEHHDVTLRGQVAAQDAVAGDEDGRALGGALVPPDQTDVNGDEENPNDQKQHHADGDQTRILIQIRQLSAFERKHEADQGQERVVGQHGDEERVGAFLALLQDALLEDHLMGLGRVQDQPRHAQAHLDPGDDRHENRRLVEPLRPGPPAHFKAEAQGDRSIKKKRLISVQKLFCVATNEYLMFFHLKTRRKKQKLFAGTKSWQLLKVPGNSERTPH